jgi:hypothetical protein
LETELLWWLSSPLEPDGDEQWPLKFCARKATLLLLLFNFGFVGAARGEQDKISICSTDNGWKCDLGALSLVASKTKTLSRSAHIISKLKMNENKYRREVISRRERVLRFISSPLELENLINIQEYKEMNARRSVPALCYL